MEHLTNALQNITTDRTTHSVHERLNFPPPFAVATIPTILMDYLHYWLSCFNILQPWNFQIRSSCHTLILKLVYSLMVTVSPHFHHNAHEPPKVQSPSAKAEWGLTKPLFTGWVIVFCWGPVPAQSRPVKLPGKITGKKNREDKWTLKHRLCAAL